MRIVQTLNVSVVAFIFSLTTFVKKRYVSIHISFFPAPIWMKVIEYIVEKEYSQQHIFREYRLFIHLKRIE